MPARTILVSNRLSVRVSRGQDGEFQFNPSVGGLATGLSSVIGDGDLWVGWSGLPEDSLAPEERGRIAETLRAEHGSIAVPLTQADLDLFYSGFCNDTIWPLFHYFPTFTEFDPNTWEAYRRVNEAFFAQLEPLLEPGVRVWVHDYQLMLLPRLIKEAMPEAQVGFFLHIPFPSYELFRLLPWGPQLLEGVLGADLVGFHTYDYARHFLSSVRRLLGYDHSLGVVQTQDRAVQVDVFPMGIDFQRFADAGSDAAVQELLSDLRSWHSERRMVLSVDRLDYSKGIPGRLRSFGRLLARHSEWHGRVSLRLIVSPSRESVPRYIELKQEIDGLVSEINGRYSTMDWVPIHYQYQTADFGELSALYRAADVLLVTPLRDGMNLIAKEYIAAREDHGGALVLSETAGAARELGEAIHVAPTDIEGIADALHAALSADPEDSRPAMEAMRKRVARHTVQRWAADFMERLAATEELQASYRAEPFTRSAADELVSRWTAATSRLLVLDYDGTLMRFFRRPGQAKPDPELLGLLTALSSQKGTRLVVSSGRDRANLDAWLGHLDCGLGAGHGAWIRDPGSEWRASAGSPGVWKEAIRPVIERTVDRTPGSQLEEKDFSLAWHYRNAEPELANVRLAELRDTLLGLTDNFDLSVLDGNRVLEIKPSHVHKGHVVEHFVAAAPADLVLALGDDATDEFMFQAAPPEAVTIKVGVGSTAARYSINGVPEVRALLSRLRDVTG